MSELAYLSAQEAIKLFSRKQLSPVELMQAIIERVERVEPQINAFSHTDFQQALQQAAQAEKRYLQGNPRPLEGIPTAIKSSFDIKGQVSSTASNLIADSVASQTSPSVQRLLDAGAIVHARTTVPEFTCVSYTWSHRFGVTRNPWNPTITPGGSSGGSGAALAAGTTTLANGGDIAGSIRIPAALCGLVGFKAPYGRVPDKPPYNLEYYFSAGPLARDIHDCILMQNLLSGSHRMDIASALPALELPQHYGSIKGWRIAYSLDLGYQPLASEVQDNTLQALQLFRELGAQVEAVDIPWDWSLLEAAKNHLAYAVTNAPLLEYSGQLDQLTPYARQYLQDAQAIKPQQAYQAEVLAGKMHQDMQAVFENHDLFICPTLAGTGVAAEFDSSRQSVALQGDAVDSTMGWLMTYPFNMLSRYPVLSMPSGLAGNGVPTGIQLVASAYEDQKVFQAGTAYQQAWGGFAQGFPTL